MKKKYLLFAPLLVGAVLTSCGKSDLPDTKPISKEDMAKKIEKTGDTLKASTKTSKGVSVKLTAKGSASFETCTEGKVEMTNTNIDASAGITTYDGKLKASVNGKVNTSTNTTLNAKANAYLVSPTLALDYDISGKLDGEVVDPIKQSVKGKITDTSVLDTFQEYITVFANETYKDVSQSMLMGLSLIYSSTIEVEGATLKYGVDGSKEVYTFEQTQAKTEDIPVSGTAKITFAFDAGYLTKLAVDADIDYDGSKIKGNATLNVADNKKDITAPDLTKYTEVPLEQVTIPMAGGTEAQPQLG